MKVFISWSGERSRAIAERIHSFLPLMLQGVRPFISSHDLTSGGRWSAQLSRELDEAQFGIICLTPDNLHSDWILFEAGALTKHVEGKACCLLFAQLRPADVAGPLAQFQNHVFERAEVLKLLLTINAILAAPLPEGSVQVIFDKWWPDLEVAIRTALEQLPASAVVSRRLSADIIEEILLGVRRIQARVDQVTPSLTISTLDPSLATSPGSTDESYFTVTFQALIGAGPDVLVKFDPYATFQMFLNEMYKFVAGRVPPSAYGTFWIFRDAETAQTIEHARMRADGDPNVRDYRRLTEVGIRPGSKLEAVRVNDPGAA